jgi:hypothetical protein
VPLSCEIATVRVSFAGLPGTLLVPGLPAGLSAELSGELPPVTLPSPQAAREKAITQHRIIATKDFDDFSISVFSFLLSFLYVPERIPIILLV